MELFLIKDDKGLFHPLSEMDIEKANKIKVMEENCFTLKRIRNPRFHRKYFGLIKLAYDNQEQYKDIDDFRLVMQMKAGYYKRVVTDKGVTFLPKSIAFSEMEQQDFEELYDKIFTVITETFKLEQKDRERFEMELNSFA